MQWTGKTLIQCAELCSNQPGSVAFEYGMDYGGSPYNPRDCLCQDSTNWAGCDGNAVNLDLYLKDISGYAYVPKGCVRAHNIATFDGLTRDGCAVECNKQAGCQAFEYGAPYGGSPYEPGVCILNDASDTTDCDGEEVNLDLYLRDIPGDIPGYEYIPKGCVRAHNIATFDGLTRDGCAVECNKQAGCLAFEYGASYGGSPYEAGVCILNDSSDTSGCDGESVNLDVYVKS